MLSKINDSVMYDKLKELREDGEVVWSISRLNTYENCPMEFFLTYLTTESIKISVGISQTFKVGDIIAISPGVRVYSIQDNEYVELEDRLGDVCHLKFLKDCSEPFEIIAEYRDYGSENIYSFAGSKIHDALEKIHADDFNDSANKEDINPNILLRQTLADISVSKVFDSDLQFPQMKDNPSLIEDNWVRAITQFADTFERLPHKTLTEQLFVYEIMPNIFIHGYIDIITTNDDGEIVLLDWKTSSRFTGKRRLEAGRQLVLYAMAVEEVFGVPVDKVGWYMVKYGRVHYGKRSKMVDRGRWVKEIEKQVRKYMEKLEYPEIEIEGLVSQAVKNNSMDGLPKDVRDHFIFEPLIEYYDITEELKEELKDYIKRVISEIGQEITFNPIPIDYKTVFFCENLCGQNARCPAYRNYVEDQKMREEELARYQ